MDQAILYPSVPNMPLNSGREWVGGWGRVNIADGYETGERRGGGGGGGGTMNITDGYKTGVRGTKQ